MCSLGGKPPRGAASASPANGAALGANAATSLLALAASLLGAGAGGTYEARAETGAGASSSRSMSRVLRRSIRGVDPRGELARLDDALEFALLPGVATRGDESETELRPRGLASRRAEFGTPPRAESCGEEARRADAGAARALSLALFMPRSAVGSGGTPRLSLSALAAEVGER